MNIKLHIKLLGNPIVMLDDEPVIGFRSRKAQALLYYLAATRRPQTRTTLASLFWGDVAEQHARRSLTSVLSNLRQLLGHYLHVDRESIVLVADEAIWLDLDLFQRTVASGQTEQLAEVVALYQGDFLEGFFIADAPEFEQWVLVERTRLREMLLQTLDTLAALQAKQSDLDAAIASLRRVLIIEPWREETHRQLMVWLAQNGQRAVALAQYEQCRQLLAAELDVEPDEETEALVEQIRASGIEKLSTPLPVADHHRETQQRALSTDSGDPRQEHARQEQTHTGIRHNLTAQSTPFVGRRQELTDLQNRLLDPQCRLITLVGPGGIGKTRLALAAAEQHLPHMADGIYIVPLQPVASPTAIFSAIANAIGFRFYTDAPPQEQLIDYLHHKQMLLVLDNFEHLLEGTDLIAQLMANAPLLKIIATSREALRIQEEWFHPITGLRFPHDEQFSPESLAVFDAVALFVQSARRSAVNFSLQTEWPHVAHICRLVEGMPLGIELAAAWLKIMPCKEIADEIVRGLDILTTRQLDLPERHRSVRAVLEQSWHMLGDTEKDVLSHLSVFRGGFDQVAASEIANASLLMLVQLVEKSLVLAVEDGRYHIHEMLRQFIAEKLAEQAGMADQTPTATHRLHCLYFVHLLLQQAPTLLGAEQGQAVQLIGIEIENMRAALLWAMTHQRATPIVNVYDSSTLPANEPSRSAELVTALEPLYHFYQIQSRYLEGSAFFSMLLDSWRADVDDAIEVAQQIELYLLARLGAFYYLLCDYDAADRYLIEALTLAGPLNAPRERAFILNFLGRLAMWQGEKVRAKTLLLESLALSRALHDENRTASGLEKLASLIYATFGEYEECKILALESLAISRKLGRPDRIAYALDTLGFATFCLGEYAESQQYYDESLKIFELTGDHYGRAMALGGLGLVYWGVGKETWPKASQYFQKSLEICRELGHDGQVAGRLAGLARLANDQQNFAKARRLAQEALTIARDLGSPVYLLHALYSLGESAYRAGDLKGARAYIVEALDMAVITDLLSHLAIVLYHYAMLLLCEEELIREDALRNQRAALQILRVVRDHPATWHVYRERANKQLAALPTAHSTGEELAPMNFVMSVDLDATAKAILQDT